MENAPREVRFDGVIALDKPAGISSAAAVARVKRLLPRGVKIGHAGTLDPFATGLLLLLVGRATRACEQLMDGTKEYLATIAFGATTPTDDPTAPAVAWPSGRVGAAHPPSREELNAALAAQTGRILQRPPVFSALKVGGRRAYDLARRGQPPELAPRVVSVHSIDLLDFEWPRASIHVSCGRGVYIRAIARDLGAALDVGAYLSELRRTRVGAFTIAGAVTLESLSSAGPAGVAAALEPVTSENIPPQAT